MYVGTHMLQHTCGGRGETYRTLFSMYHVGPGEMSRDWPLPAKPFSSPSVKILLYFSHPGRCIVTDAVTLNCFSS